MLHNILISIFLCCISLASTFASNSNAYVIASALRLREAPGLDAKTIKLLAYGEKINTLKHSTLGHPIEIDGLQGRWIPVVAGEDSGYAFSAYIATALPAKPQSDIVMIDPDGISYSNFTYSPSYFWYRLGKKDGCDHLVGLTQVHPELYTFYGTEEIGMRIDSVETGYILGFAKEQEVGIIT